VRLRKVKCLSVFDCRLFGGNTRCESDRQFCSSTIKTDGYMLCRAQIAPSSATRFAILSRISGDFDLSWSELSVSALFSSRAVAAIEAAFAGNGVSVLKS